jgi:hypothetical protein
VFIASIRVARAAPETGHLFSVPSPADPAFLRRVLVHSELVLLTLSGNSRYTCLLWNPIPKTRSRYDRDDRKSRQSGHLPEAACSRIQGETTPGRRAIEA